MKKKMQFSDLHEKPSELVFAELEGVGGFWVESDS